MTREERLDLLKQIEKLEEIISQLQSVKPQKTGHWIDGLIAKVLEEVDGGTDDNYIRYTDICDRVTKSIRNYCEANMESEE